MTEAEQTVEPPVTHKPLDRERAVSIWDAARERGLTAALQFGRRQADPFTSDAISDEYRVVVVGNAATELSLEVLNDLNLFVQYRKLAADPVIEGGQVIFR